MSLTKFSPSHFDVRNIEGSAWSGSFHLGRRYRVFIGVLLMRSALSTAAVAVPVITAISTETQADTERVLVHATEHLQYTAFKLQEPLRLVVDFSSTSLGDLPQPIPIRGEIVDKIEPIVFPDEGIVRLMLYLRRGASHTIEAQAQQLRITFRKADESASTGLQHPVAEVKTAKMAETVVEDVTFVSLADRSVLAMQTAGTPPQVRVRLRQEPLRLVVDVKNASLSPAWGEAELRFDPGSAVTDLRARQIETESGSHVKVEIHLRAPTPFEVQQDKHLVQLVLAKSVTMANSAPSSAVPPPSAVRDTVVPESSPTLPFVAQVSPVDKTAASPRGGQPMQPSMSSTGSQPTSASPTTIGEAKQYTGQKISLDFQNADINDILRLIAEVSGLNVIAGGDVQGTVTTRMVDVPWDQALDVILKINGLAQEREGNIIRVAPLKRFIAERQERVQAQKTEVEAEPTVTQLVRVSYADAEELKTNLERLLSDRGSIFIDERTNTLIMTDTQQNLDDIMVLLGILDRQTPQVVIEARIVETSRNFLRDLGVQLGFAYSGVTDRTFPSTVDISGSATQPGNFLVDLPAAVGAGSGGAMTFALAGASSLLNIRLSALESSGQGKIISSPKIATLDNTEALIQSGRRIPYQTVSAEGTQTEFVDASVSLKVTPHVTPDGYVNMKIVATNNDADFGATSGGAPTIVTREATTEMLVKDGDTVVIGGLYKRTIQESSEGVPGLQDVPVLGWLFNKKRREDRNEELLIFITPRIIRQPNRQGRTKTAVTY